MSAVAAKRVAGNEFVVALATLPPVTFAVFDPLCTVLKKLVLSTPLNWKATQYAVFADKEAVSENGTAYNVFAAVTANPAPVVFPFVV